MTTEEKRKKDYWQKYYHENKERLRQYRKQWRDKNKHKIRAIYIANKNRMSAYGKKRRYEQKIEIFTFYSQGIPKCACCGEKEIEFLTIDHINGGGCQHKKETKNHLYEWIVKNKYPEGFRILCMNCNLAIGKLGYCPHTKIEGTNGWM